MYYKALSTYINLCWDQKTYAAFANIRVWRPQRIFDLEVNHLDKFESYLDNVALKQNKKEKSV
jgi:hypothetical protein